MGRRGAIVVLGALLVLLTGCGPAAMTESLPPMPVAEPAPLVAPVAPVLPAAPPTTSTTTTTAAPRTARTATTTAPPPAGRTLPMAVTFYAAYDNDPAGSTEIAYPQLHDAAGGRGTYANPLTFATHPDEIAPGTRVYVPSLRKYFLMEDSCAQCIDEWDSARTRHIDLWAGAATDAGVLACEDALTPSGTVRVELAPPAGRPVDTTPFYDDGQCLSS